MSVIEGPKKKTRASKKSKKSWRKNTDIDDVEEFLEDKRLEERIGGNFSEKKDDELFVVETVAEEPEDENQSRRKKRRQDKPLKCFQHLEITTGAPDPKKGRNRRKTPVERKNPIVKAQEKKLQELGVVKAKTKLAQKNRELVAARKKATELERSTRRRTEFDFDLWEDGDKADELENKEWIEPNTKRHTRNSTGKMQRKLPEGYHDKTSKLPAVELPHSGSSYNPSYKAHQDILMKASLVQLKKERDEKKIERATTMMFPTQRDAPTIQTWIEEMSEGIDELIKKKGKKEAKEPDVVEEEKEEAEEDDEGEEEEETKANKLKTKKQRRKERLAREEEFKRTKDKEEKQKEQDVFKLKAVKRQIQEEETLTKERMEKRAKAAEAKQFKAHQLSKHKFEEPDLDVKLSDEISGNLRSLKPEGNLLQDRFKSLQKRNIIAVTLPEKAERKKKRKKYEKRNYKMGWEEEYHAQKNAKNQHKRDKRDKKIKRRL